MGTFSFLIKLGNKTSSQSKKENLFYKLDFVNYNSINEKIYYTPWGVRVDKKPIFFCSF